MKDFLILAHWQTRFGHGESVKGTVFGEMRRKRRNLYRLLIKFASLCNNSILFAFPFVSPSTDYWFRHLMDGQQDAYNKFIIDTFLFTIILHVASSSASRGDQRRRRKGAVWKKRQRPPWSLADHTSDVVDGVATHVFIDCKLLSI